MGSSGAAPAGRAIRSPINARLNARPGMLFLPKLSLRERKPAPTHGYVQTVSQRGSTHSFSVEEIMTLFRPVHEVGVIWFGDA
jgi:hypothetical protein